MRAATNKFTIILLAVAIFLSGIGSVDLYFSQWSAVESSIEVELNETELKEAVVFKEKRREHKTFSPSTNTLYFNPYHSQISVLSKRANDGKIVPKFILHCSYLI